MKKKSWLLAMPFLFGTIVITLLITNSTPKKGSPSANSPFSGKKHREQLHSTKKVTEADKDHQPETFAYTDAVTDPVELQKIRWAKLLAAHPYSKEESKEEDHSYREEEGEDHERDAWEEEEEEEQKDRPDKAFELDVLKTPATTSPNFMLAPFLPSGSE